MIEQLLTVEQIAERIGCSIRTVRRWVSSGALASVKISGLRRVSPSALDRFIGIERTDWASPCQPVEPISRTEFHQYEPVDCSDD